MVFLPKRQSKGTISDYFLTFYIFGVQKFNLSLKVPQSTILMWKAISVMSLASFVTNRLRNLRDTEGYDSIMTWVRFYHDLGTI